jgi:hypothetical protein
LFAEAAPSVLSHIDYSHTDLKDLKDYYAALRLHIPVGAPLVGALHSVADSVAIFKIFKIRVKKQSSEEFVGFSIINLSFYNNI